MQNIKGEKQIIYQTYPVGVGSNERNPCFRFNHISRYISSSAGMQGTPEYPILGALLISYFAYYNHKYTLFKQFSFKLNIFLM